LGPKRAADEKPLLKEVEKRVEERLKSENGYGAKS
jgi:hypothetical protein